MKRIICLMLVFLMVVGVMSGCGTTEKTVGTEETSEVAQVPAPESEETSPDAAEETAEPEPEEEAVAVSYTHLTLPTMAVV